MKQLCLDTKMRVDLARRILTSLENAVPGSIAQLRGSLADERADAYSDIDVFWEVPDELFQESMIRIADILSEVHPVESLRLDSDFQNSDRRRLIFVQFKGLPLFWRVDIDILAQSVHRDFEYDLHNPAARGDNWSRTHSALMNAIAAIKALLRNKEDAAKLLIRGFERVSLPAPNDGLEELILQLASSIAIMDPAKSELAHRIMELHREVFGPIENS